MSTSGLLARTVGVAGFRSCGFYQLATKSARMLEERGLIRTFEDKGFGTRDEYFQWLSQNRKAFVNSASTSEQSSRISNFASSPLTYIDGQFLGGNDDFQKWINTRQGIASDDITRLSPVFGNNLATNYDGSLDQGDDAFRRLLNPTEFQVLRRCATEVKGVGEELGGFDDVYLSGTYLCAACSSPLYESSAKFDCGCGWPGFFDCLPSAVRAIPDKDGVRTEAICNSCGSHIGHVYADEGFMGMECETSGNTVATNHRHCVNSVSVVLARASEGGIDLRPCTYRGLVYLHSERRPDRAREPTDYSMPWTESE